MEELMGLSVRAGLGGLLLFAGCGLVCLPKGKKLQWLALPGALAAVAGLLMAVVYGWKLSMAKLAIPEVRFMEWQTGLGGGLMTLGAFLNAGGVKFFQERKAFQILGVLLFLAGMVYSVYYGVRLLQWYFQ